MSTKPSLFLRESFAEYFSQRREYLSSHALADLRARPLVYQMKRDGLIDDRETTTNRIGQEVHCLLLEGRAEFERRYAISDGPINDNTGKPYGRDTKKYTEWEMAQGRPVLTTAQSNEYGQMVAGIDRCPVARQYLTGGVAEGVVRVEDYYGHRAQIRIDYFTAKHGIVDLKSCDNLNFFHHDAKRYGYIYQLAYYWDVFAKRAGFRPQVRLLAVEKKPPFCAGVWYVNQADLEIAAEENRRGVTYLLECERTNKWPSGFDIEFNFEPFSRQG